MKVAYIANRFPRWGGGWVLNEVRGLTGAGVDLDLYSFKPPLEDVATQSGLSDWIARTTYVPRGSSWQAIRAGLICLLSSPVGFVRGLRAALNLGGRMARGAHMMEVFYLAHRIRRSGATHIHAQHGDYLADAAMAAAACLKLPFSFTGHANDLYTNPGRLREKIRAATFVATCTGFNEHYLKRLGIHPEKIRRVYHGVDLERFRFQEAAAPPDRLVCITRLKEKKGFPYLLDALAALKAQGRPFHLAIYGDGDQRAAIEGRIASLGLGDRVTLQGSISHDQIPAALGGAGIYVLACVVLANQDRDGIPNTILEALASGVPVVSTDISGIPEAVRDGESGLLVPERDPVSLAAALGRMMSDAALRQRCARGGRRIVEESFSIPATGRALAALFGAAGTTGRATGRG